MAYSSLGKNTVFPFTEPVFLKSTPQRAAAETKTKGGLLIPEKAQNKGLEAVVMAVGPGRRAEGGATVPIAVAVGDKVSPAATVNLTFTA